MTHSKIKAFKVKLTEIVSQQVERAKNDTADHLQSFDSIKFVVFNNESPYQGSFSNTIFFTYSDHYRGNSGTWMNVGHLGQPHTNMDDRGYIKGVATDLDGYMKLRSANRLNHNVEPVANIYFPRFRKSKHSAEYANTCTAMVNDAIKAVDDFIITQRAVLNERLNSLTGCSLLFYLRDIN